MTENRCRMSDRFLPISGFCHLASDLCHLTGTEIERPACFGPFRRHAVRQPTVQQRQLAFPARRLRHRLCLAARANPRSDPTSSRFQISRARLAASGHGGCGKRLSANEPGCCAAPCASSCIPPAGGARRDRTDDLLLAKQALSQLSYGPVQASGISNQVSVSCGAPDL
jgi:hypothetical protein